MSTETFDYTGFEDDTPEGDGELAQLSRLAEEQRLAEQEVEEAQRQLKVKQDRLNDIAERLIPELMEQVGLNKVTTRGGLEVLVQEAIRASMGKGAEKEAATDWLEQNGHEAIIKLQVVTQFGRGDEERERAHRAVALLREAGYAASFERQVHPQTLAALIRELLEQGADVPEDMFHVHRQRRAKVK